MTALEIRRELWHQKNGTIERRCFRRSTFSYVGTIPDCDGQTRMYRRMPTANTDLA